MPKQVLQVTDFSSGLNCYSDARDINDNQFAQNWNAVVDKAGVIRTSGMAETSISTDSFDNTNFQAGYGLFQFSADYSTSEISGDFNFGIKSGTLSAGSSTTSTLESSASSPGSADYYKYMHFFVKAGTRVGKSADITGSTDASPPVLTTGTGGATNNTSQYIIYPWYYKGYGTAQGANGVTDGVHTSMESAIGGVGLFGYYFFSKRTVTDDQSSDFGYMTYNWDGTDSQLTLKAGVTYYLSLRCAGAQKFVNAVCNGHINPNNDGSTTTHVDRVPGISLQNDSVEDNSGCIRDCSASVGASLSDSWQDGQTHYNIGADSAKSNGGGASFNIVTSNGGDTVTFYYTAERGRGYKVDDVLTFKDPGDTDETCTLTVSAVNKKGLKLYSGGKIVSNQDCAVDTTGSTFLINYIANGDFALGGPSNDGTANGWTEYDSGGLIACTELSSDGYDGHDGTLQIVSSGLTYDNDIPSSYIFQDVNIPNGRPYHLNFQYDSSDGIMYMIRDRSTGRDEFVHGWRRLPPTRSSSDDANYRFAGAEYKTRYSLSGNIDSTYNMNYITFDLENKPLGTLTTVDDNVAKSSLRIAFAPVAADSTVNLTGITLVPATNDLVTMGYQNDNGNNPFNDGFKSWSIYNCSFTIPSNWNDDSNYLLEFNFGEFGFRSGNSLSATSEQKIYVDDIRLSSNESDTTTLLLDNTNLKSAIHAHSSKTNSWKTDYITWNDINSKPVFNYINGMLKISDSNFSNDNQNKFVYFSDKSKIGSTEIQGWKFLDDAIPAAPTIVVREPTEDLESDESFLAHDYLNLYFHGQYFGRVPGDGQGFGQHLAGPPLNDFGENNIWLDDTSEGRPRVNGIFIRSFLDENSYHDAYDNSPGHVQSGTGGYWAPSWWDWPLNPDSDWYQDNILLGHDVDGETNSKQQENTTNNELCDFISNFGWDSDGNVIEYSNDSNTLDYRPNNPIQMVIKGNDNETYNIDGVDIPPQGMNQKMGEQSGDVRSVTIRAKYKAFFRTTGNDMESYSSDGVVGRCPVFQFQAGKHDDLNDTQLLQRACTGDAIDFGSYFTTSFIGNGTVNINNLIGAGGGKSSAFTAESYDDEGKVTGVDASLGYFGSPLMHLTGWPIYFEVDFEDTIEFLPNVISRVDDLVLKLWSDGATSMKSYDRNHWEAAKVIADNSSYQTFENSDNLDVNSDAGFSNFNLTEKFLINSIVVDFYNVDTSSDSDVIIGGGKETQANFTFGIPQGVSSTGWGDRVFKIATTSVNTFGEESAFSEASITIGEEGTTGLSNITIGNAPSILVSIGDIQLNDDYIEKTKFYMRDTNSDIWYLQFYVNHKNIRLYSTTSSVSSLGTYDSVKGVTTFLLLRENFLEFNEVNSYESETMVSQDEAYSNANLTCRYKASVVANNRMYVGNIYQNGRQYGDRMIKSPIGKYNILPSSNFVDVAINDGDEITALAYYKDKLLQFKKKKIFVINTSGDYHFLEDTFENVGVTGDYSVATTPHGIVWANRTGFYLYNGEQMVNLIDKIIPTTSDYATISNNYWLTSDSTNNNPVVGYIENRDCALIKFKADQVEETVPSGISYHFGTKSWTFLQKVFSGKSDEASTGDISNMITNDDGDILFYRLKSDDAFSDIKKWTNSPLNNYSSTNFKTFYFTTKDFTFGDISTRKKLYKVYITYKVGTDGTDSGVGVYAQVNGTEFDGTVSNNIRFNQASKFAGTSTVCYAGETLDETDAKWKTAELKFATSNEVNNIYSFQLLLYSVAVAADFEVNDISIVYRTKNIR